MNLTVINRHRVMRSILILVLMFYMSVQAQEIVTENGIRYIENSHSIQGGSSGIELKYIRTYGGLDAEDESEILYYPRDLVVDKDNNLYIMDIKGPHVVTYNKNGQFVRKFGRKGQGPGEFGAPRGLGIDSLGQLYVSEWLARFVNVFSPTGQNIMRLYPDATLDFPDFEVMRSGNLICGTKEFPNYLLEGEIHKEPVMEIYSQAGDCLKRFGELVHFKDISMTKTGNSVFFVLDKHDNIYVTYRFQNRIEKYLSDGTHIMTISRKLNYKISLKAKIKLRIRKNGIVYGYGNPIMNVVSCGIAVDKKNRIWVMTFSRQPEYEKFCEVADDQCNYANLEVYQSDGVLIRKIALEDNFEPNNHCVFIHGDRLFLLNSNDVSVKEYRIIN
ncbi:6-bladed beta-propeller [bacterium]|nr:6-bladed beta-propeller [bacterium]